MGILKINALEHQYVQNVKIQITQLKCKNPFNCTEHTAYSRECEMWKKELQK